SSSSGFLSFVQQVPVLNGVFFPLEGFFDLFNVFQGIVQKEEEFRNPSQLVLGALGQFIADAGPVGSDPVHKFLGPFVGEDAQVDLGQGEVDRDGDLGYGDQGAPEPAIRGGPL